MTHTDYTKLMLNIEDKNIYFNENCLEIVKIKGIDTKVFHGHLTYTPDFCPKCGCKHCNRTFTASSNIVDFHKQISNDTNLNIKLELMEKGSEKDIAKRNNVSPNHVNRILDTISQDKLIKNYGKLPEKIGIDEFNAAKDTKSKMAFIVVNQDSRNIFDINNSRLSLDVEK